MLANDLRGDGYPVTPIHDGRSLMEWRHPSSWVAHQKKVPAPDRTGLAECIKQGKLAFA